jgi:PAS domain S-box-containing protein
VTAPSPTSDLPSPQPPEAAHLLRAIVDSADDAIISKDLQGTITSWNTSAERIFGYSANEIVGRSILTLLPADRQHEESAILEKIRNGQRVDHFETIRVRKDGRRIPISVTISPIRNAAGAIVGASKVARDLSLYRRAEQVESLLTAIIDSSDDAIISKDLNSIVTSWNPGAQQIFGYTSDEMVGQPIWRLFPPDRWDEEPRILDQIKQGKRVEHFETKRIRKDGKLIDISVSISPVRNSRGDIIGASKIARDITEQKEVQARLIAAHQELQRADQLKSEFLATLSHELRTPLNAILGWLQVLRETGNDPNELNEGLAVIERNARAQAQMIEDLLDVSRIASGKVLLDIQQANLPAIVEAALQTLSPAAQAKSIRLTAAFSSVEGSVMGDRNRLQQVFWNLLSNAIKFTPKGGRVHVTIERRHSHVEVAVTDNGNGIKAEFLPHVFERFRQADGTTARRHGGLGLGLSIVKQLIEMHGGEVRAQSAGEGQGSTFTISLPILASRVPDQEASLPPFVGDSAKRVETAPPLPLNGIRVLTVDDEPDSLRIVARILESRGAVVHAVRSASEALAVIAQDRPDVLISDIGMPEQDGYELIRSVRAQPHLHSLPAVALTALARTEDRTRALLAGFQTHVPKPVEANELVAVVASLVSLRRQDPAVVH